MHFPYIIMPTTFLGGKHSYFSALKDEKTEVEEL